MSLPPCSHGQNRPHLWRRTFINEDGGHDFSWGHCDGPWEGEPNLWVYLNGDNEVVASGMSDTTWHVFYRTMGMAARNEKGWARADFLAESAEDAIEQLQGRKHRVQHVRVYPGEAAFVAEMVWSSEVVVKHEPHELVEVDE